LICDFYKSRIFRMNTSTNIFPDVIQFFGGTATAAAEALDCSIQTICNYRDGREVPADMCIKIEKRSKRKFLCEQLNSKIDWQYLRGTKKKVA
jgi:DNA-binding transcriptional regulator YdaS (Cro superfamily)